jgi:hypothetical protein
MRRLAAVWTCFGFFVTAEVTGLPAFSFAADSIAFAPLNAVEFLPGQQLFRGFSLSRTRPVDVYMGVAIPSFGIIAFFDPAAKVTIVGNLESPASIPRLAAYPGSPLMNFPGIYFPTTGLEDGAYDLQLFIASVIAGAFQDNVLAPGELLAIDVKPITLLYSRTPRFEFETSVPSSQRALIQQWVQQTADLLSALGAPEIGAVTVFVFNTLDGLGEAYGRWLNITPAEAIQQKGHLFPATNEGGLGFVFLDTNMPPGNGQSVYHELFHVLQNRLTQTPIFQGDFVPIGGPVGSSKEVPFISRA